MVQGGEEIRQRIWVRIGAAICGVRLRIEGEILRCAQNDGFNGNGNTKVNGKWPG